MELSGFPPTPSSAPFRNILVNSEGHPLKINLQAVELEGRPKLVRTLKGSGALVVSNAKEAVIILVDSATESGKRLIRTWGHDASKVVLEHTWVHACVNVGRALLGADYWGGAMTVDDGKPVTIDGVVVDEDELEEVEALVTKSPLPTPRVTPVDPTTQRPENTTEHSDVAQLESQPNTPSNATGLLPSLTQPAVSCAAPSGEVTADAESDEPQPPPSLSLPPTTQPLPYIQPTSPVQPQNTYPYTPLTTQQPHPSSQSQMMPTQPFPPTGFPPSQQQMAHPPSLPHTSLPPTQSQMMLMTPNTTSINGVNLQNPNFATIMTIMEVVRHMDQSSWLGQNQLPIPQLSANSSATTFSMQLPVTSGPAPSASVSQVTGKFPYPGVDASLSKFQNHLDSAATPSRKHESSRDVSEDHSITRKSRKRPSVAKPANPPSKRLRKGKERAIFTGSSDDSEVGGLMEVSDGSYSTYSSASPLERPRNIVARKKHGEIFLSGSGQSLRFFVQVDLHGRHSVVTNIKKNMGKIVNNIADADYLILSPRSDTFQGLLNEAIALGKSPILAAFVADCVEEGALLNETDYILESVSKVKGWRRGRRSAFSIKVEASDIISPQIKTVQPKAPSATAKGKRAKETPTKTPENKKSNRAFNSPPSIDIAHEAADLSASRSPTPPPASTRRVMKTGKYLFTKEEDEYLLRLAKHHLNHDPAISNTALVCKLHKKMPHHTAASWGAHFDQKMKSAVEDVRKRANIAKRKRDSEVINQNSLRENVNEECNVAVEKGNIPSDPGQPSLKDLERQDFDVITQFFASGGGDDEDDERVWEELQKHSSCRSANSWPNYYAAHQKEVYTRIEELMNERVGN